MLTEQKHASGAGQEGYSQCRVVVAPAQIGNQIEQCHNHNLSGHHQREQDKVEDGILEREIKVNQAQPG